MTIKATTYGATARHAAGVVVGRLRLLAELLVVLGIASVISATIVSAMSSLTTDLENQGARSEARWSSQETVTSSYDPSKLVTNGGFGPLSNESLSSLTKAGAK